MNKLKRKTLKMPVRYLMNTVLVVLLFVLLSFMTQNVLSTYQNKVCLLYTSPSPRDVEESRMPSSA